MLMHISVFKMQIFRDISIKALIKKKKKKKVKGQNTAVTAKSGTLTAVFCPFTHTQPRASLAREWLEDKWSGINGSVSGVLLWYSLPLLSLSSLE